MAYELKLNGNVQTAAAVHTYKLISETLLKELVNNKPRTIDLKKLEAKLIKDMKGTLSNNENYETEIEFVQTGISVIEAFFGTTGTKG